MKTCLLGLILFGVVAATGSAQTLSSSVGNNREVSGKTKAAPIQRPGVYGVFPRAFARDRNPLQMLNPRAPAKYGTAEQSVMFDPNVPGKWNGIKLFQIVF